MENTEFELETKADLIARDASEQIVLLVKVSTNENEDNNVQQLISTWKALRVLIPFAMSVNLQTISIYKRNKREFSTQPIKSLKTADVLRVYEPEFGEKRILKRYLITLFESWLRDLAYHWKLKNPPAAEQLEEIGLLQKIEGGTTESEVELDRWLVNYNEGEILDKIQNEIISILDRERESSLQDMPEKMQQKIKEVSHKILNILYE